MMKKLKNYIIFKNGKKYKYISSFIKADNMYPVYGSGGIIGYTNNFIINHPAILVPRKGTITNIFYINTPVWNIDTIYAITSINKNLKLKYLYFWLLKNINKIVDLGSTIPSLNQQSYKNLLIKIPKISYQQHIIDIIEPFEKLAEIYEKLIKLINNLFSLITKIYSLQTKEKLLSYFNFIKGTEISSSQRTKNNENKLVKYIRVGDLTFNSERQSLYCTKDNKFLCDYKNILLATDGDPGRIITGLNGVFSSSIRKVVPKITNQHSSIALLNLLNPVNKEIFNAYTTGTTIKHGGSNAIKNLKYFEYDKDIKILVKSLYENLTTLQNNLTKIIIIKKLLINKLIE